jgi:hypothetical protein
VVVLEKLCHSQAPKLPETLTGGYVSILLRVPHSAFRLIDSQMIEVSATGRDVISEDIKKSDSPSGEGSYTENFFKI